jgi:hypothetical protein
MDGKGMIQVIAGFETTITNSFRVAFMAIGIYFQKREHDDIQSDYSFKVAFMANDSWKKENK